MIPDIPTAQLPTSKRCGQSGSIALVLIPNNRVDLAFQKPILTLLLPESAGVVTRFVGQWLGGFQENV